MQGSKALLLVFFSVIFFTGIAHSQDSAYVTWKSSVKNIVENKYEIRIKGTIKPGWHLYSNANDAEGITGVLIVYEDPAIKKTSTKIIANNINIQDLVFEKREVKVATDSIIITEEINFDGLPAPVIKFNMNYYVGYNENFIPEEKKISLVLDEGAVSQTVNRILIPSININKPLTDCGKSSSSANDTKSKGLLNVFWLGFLGGFIA